MENCLRPLLYSWRSAEPRVGQYLTVSDPLQLHWRYVGSRVCQLAP